MQRFRNLVPRVSLLAGEETLDKARFSKVPRTFRARKGRVVKLQSASFEKLIFKHGFNARKTKRIAKFDGWEPQCCEDVNGIVAPEIDPKSSCDFRETDPRPLVRSRVSATLWQWTKEGLFNKNIVVKHFLSTWKRDHRAKNTRPPYCCAMFLSSLQVSICNSRYFNPNLRLKQV